MTFNWREQATERAPDKGVIVCERVCVSGDHNSKYKFYFSIL